MVKYPCPQWHFSTSKVHHSSCLNHQAKLYLVSVTSVTPVKVGVKVRVRLKVPVIWPIFLFLSLFILANCHIKGTHLDSPVLIIVCVNQLCGIPLSCIADIEKTSARDTLTSTLIAPLASLLILSALSTRCLLFLQLTHCSRYLLRLFH